MILIVLYVAWYFSSFHNQPLAYYPEPHKWSTFSKLLQYVEAHFNFCLPSDVAHPFHIFPLNSCMHIKPYTSCDDANSIISGGKH